MTIDESVKNMEERQKEKWLPIFRERYGNDAKIEGMECLNAGINGATYRVLVKNKKGEEREHHVRVLPGSYEPVRIDGILTSAGQNYVDFWSEYGKVIGNSY